jgi:hypothetical protein
MKNITQETENPKTFKPARTARFVLPIKNIRCVKSAVVSIQTKYDITNRAADGKDFKRICAGEEIEVLRLLIKHSGYALLAENRSNNWNGKVIVFSKAKRRVSLCSKFYFIGAFAIPSMHNAKKVFFGEISDLEYKTKHAECELFAALMLKREVAQ